jgi:hypothetical protein
MIAARGAHRRSLPPDSPALTPIAHAIRKLNARRRQAAARPPEALAAAIHAARPVLTVADAAGWFAPCGYFDERQ